MYFEIRWDENGIEQNIIFDELEKAAALEKAIKEKTEKNVRMIFFTNPDRYGNKGILDFYVLKD